MNAKSASAEQLFDEIERFIEESHAILESGAMMELAGLDDQVRSLCDAVLQLSQGERVTYADRLQKLLGDLKSLGDAMVVQRDQLADELRNVSQQKKAHKAYRVVDASDDYGNRDDED